MLLAWLPAELAQNQDAMNPPPEFPRNNRYTFRRDSERDVRLRSRHLTE
jgi:hypothetical protein